jgi:hypothetical protein
MTTPSGRSGSFSARINRLIFPHSLAFCFRASEATIEPRKKSVRRKTVRQSENVVRAATPTHDGGVMVAQ